MLTGLRGVSIAGILVLFYGLLPGHTEAEEASPRENRGLRPARPQVAAPDLGPGPIPPRRGLSAKAAPDAATSVESAIEQCVLADMAAIDAPGAAVTVIHQGSQIFNQGFGYKRRNQPERVDANTRFRIGSITKMFTAVAVMQQLEAGLLSLDDPVTDLIPELSLGGHWSADTVTIRHLLTHSSALPDYYYADFFGPPGDQELANWAASIDQVRLHAPPGTFWNYANPNFSLAGLVAERASGLFYRELMATRVFAAAGMDATTFDPDQVMASGNFSYGHHPSDSGPTTVYAPDDYDSWISGPAGFAFSTAQDLAEWALLLIDGGGSVLSPESAATMQERQIYLDYIPDFHYGFGIFAEKYKGLDVRQHGGNINGWGAYLLWVPEERFAVSVLGNTFSSLSGAAYCIVDAVLAPDPPTPPDYSTDPATWVAYTGHYRFMDLLGDFFNGEVEQEGQQLNITFTNPEEPTFYYHTELVQFYLDTFGMDGDGDGYRDLELTFIERSALGPQKMWLRNRSMVGQRVYPPRHPDGRPTTGAGTATASR